MHEDIISAFALGIIATIIFFHFFENKNEHIKFAKQEIEAGRYLDNQMMEIMYPQTYRKAYPPYLERDYEAGSYFICDEILRVLEFDFCGKDGINWR